MSPLCWTLGIFSCFILVGIPLIVKCCLPEVFRKMKENKKKKVNKKSFLQPILYRFSSNMYHDINVYVIRALNDHCRTSWHMCICHKSIQGVKKRFDCSGRRYWWSIRSYTMRISRSLDICITVILLCRSLPPLHACIMRNLGLSLNSLAFTPSNDLIIVLTWKYHKWVVCHKTHLWKYLAKILKDAAHNSKFASG